MKPRDYCCCAIPVLNAGIYATLLEQFVLGMLVAILALSTPSIVGASVPSFAKVILAIICFVGCGVQLFGFLGVFQEKAIMFRRYTTIHIMVTIAAFAVSLTWIIISASKHSTATADCENDFFSTADSSTASSTLNEGETLCNIFTWVDVGLMGGLWVILAIMQLYLYTVISSYGTGQRDDHERYKSIYSVTNFDSGIPLANRADPWDARPSFDEDAPQAPLARNVGHGRNESDGSVSTILAEKPQQEARSIYSERESIANEGRGGYPPQRQGTYASARQGSVNSAFAHPGNAYTQEPQPTPHGYADNYYSGAVPAYGNDLERPGRTQVHPAEGMFGRKSSRLQKYDRRGYDY